MNERNKMKKKAKSNPALDVFTRLTKKAQRHGRDFADFEQNGETLFMGRMFPESCGAESYAANCDAGNFYAGKSGVGNAGARESGAGNVVAGNFGAVKIGAGESGVGNSYAGNGVGFEGVAGSFVADGVFQSMTACRPTETFMPLHYEPNYAYPLIIWLHSPGEDERQLRRVMPLLSLRNYVAAAIRGGVSFGNDGLPKKGYFWDPGTYETTYAAVLRTINEMRRLRRIASDRIYLAGCEEGGTMAQRLAFHDPQHFAGVISLDGAIPEDMMLLERFKELKKVRFLYAVSRGSRTCPVESFCENLRLLYSAGVPLTLRNYPTAGSLQLDMLRDANRWIMGSIESALL